MKGNRLIEEGTERRAHSIYSRSDAACNSLDMSRIFNDPELPLSLKFSAAFAAFAQFTFPLQLSAFRTLIPDSVWHEHCRFRFTRMVAGFVPIFWGKDEWFYELRIGPQTRYGPYMIYIVANSDVFQMDERTFNPPLESSVVRFTLCHPFLQRELHDPSGIYLFTCA